MQLDMDLVIERPPDEVFALWADKERSPEWASPVLAVQMLTPPPVGVGTKFRETAKVPAGTVENTIEVTAYEPAKRMAGDWSGGMVGTWDSQFIEHEDGTLFRLQVDVKLSGWMGRLEPILGGLIKKKMGQDIQSFKKFAEDRNH